jgi:hypothetical protein
MVIFRENTEDIYAGIDFEAGSEIALKTLEFIKTNFPKEFKRSASAPSSPPPSAWASSPSPVRVPSGSSVRRSSTPSPTSASR